jgi:hypothetical protein
VFPHAKPIATTHEKGQSKNTKSEGENNTMKSVGFAQPGKTRRKLSEIIGKRLEIGWVGTRLQYSVSHHS